MKIDLVLSKEEVQAITTLFGETSVHDIHRLMRECGVDEELLQLTDGAIYKMYRQLHNRLEGEI